MRTLLVYIILIFTLISKSQVDQDSLSRVIDTTQKFESKLKVLYNASKKTVLTNSEFDFFKNKLTEITDKETSDSKQAYKIYYLGLINVTQKKFTEAISVFFESLKYAEQFKKRKLIGHIHNKLGYCYKELNKEPFAKKHYTFAVEYYKTEDAGEDLSEMYNALGTMYKNKMILDSALHFHQLALEIRLKLNNKKLLASTYNNIGLVYKKKKDNKEALVFLKKALELRKELKDKKGTAGALINIGSTLNQMSDYNQALKALVEGTELAHSIEDGDFFKNGIDALADCYYGMGDYKKAAQYYLRYNDIEDSLTSGAIEKQILELSTQYESSKKDAELSLQNEKVKTQQSEIKKQRLFMIASILVIALVLTLVILALRSNRINKRNAIHLERKNIIIEQKNKEITDSINYARRIQNSLLVAETILEKRLSDYFILYKPKDIVSGDFYWYYPTDGSSFLMAAADCTGHGVPGAFMSLIGKEKLDKAASLSNSPSAILNFLNINVKASLQQDSTQVARDGMDIALIKMQTTANGATVTYAGANRPLWIIKKNSEEIEEIKATKHAIAGFTEDDQLFEEHNIELQKGDAIYLFTDGYADQFGGELAKKLTSKSLKKLLLSQQSKNMQEQKTYYNAFITKWMEAQEQVDDILVIGIKI